MNEILCRQLALDFCCDERDVLDEKNHFSVYRRLEGRRRFLEREDCVLKLATVNGKLLFSGREDMLAWCEAKYRGEGGEWFFEAKNLRKLNDRLHAAGYQIETAHPFFIAETPSLVDTTGLTLRWYEGAEIERFRGDARFDEAYAFCPEAPDLLGVGALNGETFLGMAGASGDSPTMWQIGVNVEASARGAGLATKLVALLKNEILRRGLLPYYGTSFSHLASQRVALGAGFHPVWVELAVSKCEG